MMKNAVAIVTGASRGLGHKIARQLVQKNYHVIANYYNTPFPITTFLTSYFYKRFSQEKSALTEIFSMRTDFVFLVNTIQLSSILFCHQLSHLCLQPFQFLFHFFILFSYSSIIL